jgi:hypothetical protein
LRSDNYQVDLKDQGVVQALKVRNMEMYGGISSCSSMDLDENIDQIHPRDPEIEEKAS